MANIFGRNVDLIPGINVGQSLQTLANIQGSADVLKGIDNPFNNYGPTPSGNVNRTVNDTVTGNRTGSYNSTPTVTTPTYTSGGGESGFVQGQTTYDPYAAQRAAEAQARADEQAYWQDQISLIDQQLGRLGTQRQTGNQNIDNSYQSAFQKLTGDKTAAQRDFDTKRNYTVQDNITTRSNIDSGVRNRLTGIQRLLGASGAGNSSAANILAPYAAARTGSQQRSQVDQTYSRNLSALDQGWQDTERRFGDAFGDLDVQRQTQRNQLESGLAQTEAQLNEQKGNAALQRAQAGGASYTTARAARQPYMDRVNALIGTIDRLGVNPVLTPRAVNAAAPSLEQYTYDRYAAPSVGQTAAQGNVGPFWRLLAGQEDDERRNGTLAVA